MGRRRQAISRKKYQTGLSVKVSINWGDILEFERYFIMAGFSVVLYSKCHKIGLSIYCFIPCLTSKLDAFQAVNI